MINGTTGRQFSSTYQPPSRGRKRSVLKKYLKDNGVSIQDLRLVFQNIIIKRISELETLKEEAKELPAIVGFTVSALLKDYEAGKLDVCNSLLDRIWGKPVQQVEMGAIRDDIPEDPEERRALAERLRRELGLAEAPEPTATGKRQVENGTHERAT
jgi:hypothetical protein